MATGQTTDLSFLEDGGADLEQVRPGWPTVDPDDLSTTAPGVFVAGDLAHGTRLLIDAVASGKRAARSIYRHVTGRGIAMDALETHIPIEAYRRERGYETLRRSEIPTLAPAERLAEGTAQVEVGYTDRQAVREASRCLDCGVTPVFDGTRCVLCGGCVDVCPTLCLKLVPLDDIEPSREIEIAARSALGSGAEPSRNSAILKDEDRCIRCGLCATRCPVEAISMERTRFTTEWRPA
jgi:ferredoxin